MRSITVFILFVCCCSFVVAQNDYYRLNIQPGFGYSHHFTTVQNNHPTDYLMNMGRDYITLNWFTANYFISKNWGVNVKIPVRIHNGISSSEENGFNSFIKEYYEPDYYVFPGDLPRYSNDELLYFLSAGGVYRIVRQRWTCQLGLNIGGMQMSTIDLDYYLKEHGSNHYHSVNLKSSSKMMLSIEPSAQISYRLKKRLGLYIECGYLFSPSKYKFQEEQRDIYTNNIVHSAAFLPGEVFHMIHVNVGLSIQVGKLIE